MHRVGGRFDNPSYFYYPKTDERMVIHPQPLFGTMIPFNKDACIPSSSTATLLSNPMYNLKLARSTILVPNRQFVMRRNMVNCLIELIDLNFKVNIIFCVFSEVLIILTLTFAIVADDCLPGRHNGFLETYKCRNKKSCEQLQGGCSEGPER